MDGKQRKRAQQEATQKASLIQKSGMPFFCTILEETQGDETIIKEAVEVINKVVKKPDGTIVRDLTNVGKLLVSANEEQMVLVTHVPTNDDSNMKLTAWDWMDLILHEHGAGCGRMSSDSDPTVAIGIIPNNPSKNVYVFKLKDEIISKELDFLRGQGVLPRREEEDNDILLGDDVFE